MNICFTDIETTGLDFRKHEIIEIGAVLFHAETGNILKTFNEKVMPKSIELGDSKAMSINGFSFNDWIRSITLEEAMKKYQEFSEGSMFAAHNMIFDYSFLDEASEKTNVPLIFGRHKIDLPSLAWAKGLFSEIPIMSLKNLCLYFEIEPEPAIHRALTGAMKGYEVYKKIMSCQ